MDFDQQMIQQLLGFGTMLLVEEIRDEGSAIHSARL